MFDRIDAKNNLYLFSPSFTKKDYRKDEAENLINSFRKYIDPDSDYNQERDQKFDEWIAELNREDSQFNLNAPVLPKLDKLTTQEPNQGEGLVDILCQGIDFSL